MDLPKRGFDLVMDREQRRRYRATQSNDGTAIVVATLACLRPLRCLHRIVGKAGGAAGSRFRPARCCVGLCSLPYCGSQVGSRAGPVGTPAGGTPIICRTEPSVNWIEAGCTNAPDRYG
jgi:hypothetical protein